MHMSSLVFPTVVLSFVVLAGCSTMTRPAGTDAATSLPDVVDGIPSEVVGGPGSADTCGRAAFEGLIGTPVGDAAPFRAANATFRVIYPGDAVTEDMMPGRINIFADDVGTITSLDCF